MRTKTRKYSVRLLEYSIAITVAVLVVISMLLVAIPVFAVAPPTTLTINNVYAFRHCLEENDQLYVMDFYTSNVSGYTINEFLLFRLMNGSTQLGAVAPYYFVLQPEGRHLMAIYFDESEAPTWSGSYTAELIGNPTIDWDSGEAPYRSTTGIVWSSSTSISQTQNELAIWVLAQAQILSIEWGITLLEDIQGGSALSAYGELYFQNVIPNLTQMAPGAFAGITVDPDFAIVESGSDYSDTLQTGVTGTPLDLTTLGNVFGIGRVPVTIAIFVIILIPTSGALAVASRSTKPLMLLITPLVYCFVLVAGLPIMLAIGLGLVSMLLVGYVLFFQKGAA